MDVWCVVSNLQSQKNVIHFYEHAVAGRVSHRTSITRLMKYGYKRVDYTRVSFRFVFSLHIFHWCFGGTPYG